MLIYWHADGATANTDTTALHSRNFGKMESDMASGEMECDGRGRRMEGECVRKQHNYDLFKYNINNRR